MAMPHPSTDQKIFCLGFQKTGTNSVTQAIKVLRDVNVAGYHQFRDMANDASVTWDQVTERATRLAEEYDVFQDTPWPLLYQDFDRLYPDAKFILMIRDAEAWVRSCVGDFGSIPNQLHRLIYDAPYPEGHEERYREVYESHNSRVQSYFADRPDKLLVIRTGEESWPQLCTFLGVPEPGVPWPRANTKAQKEKLLRRQRIKTRIFGFFGLKPRP